MPTLPEESIVIWEVVPPLAVKWIFLLSALMTKSLALDPEVKFPAEPAIPHRA